MDAVFTTAVSAGPIVNSGRARALAVTSLERVPGRPDVPTLHESGFPGFDSNEWAALFGPAGLPDGIVQQLRLALTEALGDVAVWARLGQIGAVPVGSAPADFARFVRECREVMATLVREANIRLD